MHEPFNPWTTSIQYISLKLYTYLYIVWNIIHSYKKNGFSLVSTILDHPRKIAYIQELKDVKVYTRKIHGLGA